MLVKLKATNGHIIALNADHISELFPMLDEDGCPVRNKIILRMDYFADGTSIHICGTIDETIDIINHAIEVENSMIS